MSKKCPRCESKDIHITEYPAQTDNMATCYGCGYADLADRFPEQTVFNQITASPEVLAPQFIFKQWHAFDGKWGWFSLLLMDGDELNSPWFNSYDEAFAATLEKLNSIINYVKEKTK